MTIRDDILEELKEQHNGEVDYNTLDKNDTLFNMLKNAYAEEFNISKKRAGLIINEHADDVSKSCLEGKVLEFSRDKKMVA